MYYPNQLLLSCVILSLALPCSAEENSQESPLALNPEVVATVFERGESGYHSFRIPALLTTPRGTLLAFAEGRRNNLNDSGDIDLVLKRSQDKGKTWSELSVGWG